ncbi:MAG TPA: UDP-glucose/GDP-mannose dehydrogenase family protein [Bacteroidetes bacterium]|nr:UDP-glucose/GDP-mannose dehydrogenase family protein [Bacteroidota bacterium]
MKLAVVGTGYVGLVAGACFASTGNHVTCVDIDRRKIERLRQGEIPIYEPGLESLVHDGLEKGRLAFSTDLAEAVRGSEVIFIAVGTPPNEDGSADLQHVLDVAAGIGESMNGFKVIVDKSTVPVGTAEKVSEVIRSKTGGEFAVVSNPEFLKEGAAVSDFLKPDRVIIGTDDERAREIMTRLYRPFLRTGHPIIHMDIVSAELTKYAANAFLAMKISFMNEMARLCEAAGADIDSIRHGIGSDPRIGRSFLFAGAGYGGSCFPKDVRAILRTAKEFGVQLSLIEQTHLINERQKNVLFEKIMRHYDGAIGGKRFAVWGLSFKPNTDDMREAPSIELIEALLGAGAEVSAYDPAAIETAKGVFGDRITYAGNEYEAVDGADALCVVTEWNDFRTPDFDHIAGALRDRVLFDGRNLYDPAYVREKGLRYYGIGKRT